MKNFHKHLNNLSDVSKTSILVFTILLNPFLGSSQTIEKFSIDSGGASASAGNLQILYTIGEVNIQELSASSNQVSEGFINPDFKVKMTPKMFLQGPMFAPITAGLMNDNLRSSGYIPTTSPYADGATANASVFNVTGNNAIVDWVWLELRDANNFTKLVNGKSAFVQRDGDVVGLDGISPMVMNASQKLYFVVVKHRNHLGSMSGNAIGLSKTPVTVDFTNAGFPTFGLNGQAVLSTGKKALWAGDANQNGIVQYAGGAPDPSTILSEVLNKPANILYLPSFPFSGYFNTDIDLNGQTQYVGAAPDTPFILENVLANPSNILNLVTYPIEEQVPASLGRVMMNRTEFENKRINNTNN